MEGKASNQRVRYFTFTCQLQNCTRLNHFDFENIFYHRVMYANRVFSLEKVGLFLKKNENLQNAKNSTFEVGCGKDGKVGRVSRGYECG